MYRKILVPMERKDHLFGLEHAQSLSESLGAELILLRVVTVMASDDAFFQQIQIEAGSSAARIKAEAEAQMAALEQELRTQGLQALGIVVISNRSEADAIAEYAESESCDLIVMPTYQQSALSRWFLSSLGEKVRQRSSVPVLFVRATL